MGLGGHSNRIVMPGMYRNTNGHHGAIRGHACVSRAACFSPCLQMQPVKTPTDIKSHSVRVARGARRLPRVLAAYERADLMYTSRIRDLFNQMSSTPRVQCPSGVQCPCGETGAVLGAEGLFLSMPSCRSDMDACSSVSAGNGLMLLKSTCRICAAARICSGSSSSLRAQQARQQARKSLEANSACQHGSSVLDHVPRTLHPHLLP